MNAATDLTPIVKELTVAVPVGRAWTVFTAGIDTWWPVATHSVEPADVKEIVFEARVGGRILERRHDGTECPWGEVDLCDPPHRIRFSWQPNAKRPAATEVEVTFTAVDGGTRVTLEHRGWERLGAGGPDRRDANGRGWAGLLPHYQAMF